MTQVTLAPEKRVEEYIKDRAGEIITSEELRQQCNLVSTASARYYIKQAVKNLGGDYTSSPGVGFIWSKVIETPKVRINAFPGPNDEVLNRIGSVEILATTILERMDKIEVSSDKLETIMYKLNMLYDAIEAQAEENSILKAKVEAYEKILLA